MPPGVFMLLLVVIVAVLSKLYYNYIQTIPKVCTLNSHGECVDSATMGLICRNTLQSVIRLQCNHDVSNIYLWKHIDLVVSGLDTLQLYNISSLHGDIMSALSDSVSYSIRVSISNILQQVETEINKNIPVSKDVSNVNLYSSTYKSWLDDALSKY